MNKPRKDAGGAWAVDVDDHTYTFIKWGALQSLDVLAELTDIIGGPLAGIFATLEKGVKTKITTDLASFVVNGLTAKFRANKQAVLTVLQTLTSGDCVLCDGKQVKSFDRHYEGRLDHLFKVAYAGLEVQYGSFFDAARTLLGAAGEQPASDSTQGPATSIG